MLLIWALTLIVGFPLLIIGLGELIYRLQRQQQPLADTFQLIRNLLLPVLVFLLFLRHVLQLPASGQLVKSVETLLWLSAIHAALSLLNAILFEQANADTWRARVPKLLIDLLRLFLVSLGGAIVLATVWGADLAGLVTALGVSSIVIGLALQDTLGNVVLGIALLFERPFSVGDWLRVDGLVGQVIDINWRAVRLQTLEREMIVIPHKLIGAQMIRNYSQPQRLHAERIKIGFSYKDPPNLAKYVLHSTAVETQGILAEPAPQIFTLSYDDSAITYEVKFFIENYGDLEEIRDRFVTRVWYAAQRNNLNIPFPIRTLYHFNGPNTAAQSNSQKMAESLQSIPSFVPLVREASPKENRPTNLHTNSVGISLQHFGSGEKVIRQGYHSNELYIIISGQATMTVTDNLDREHEVLSLQTGEFFGEMTLFASEVSPVSIIASQDLEVMTLSATVVNQAIERQPSFVREISQILEIRRAAVLSTLPPTISRS
ncbi:mechanosensitive ion channel family protein [Chamaesiphon minutus]|uniref:Small-conductance mechanosensitive channel n=1 Tax=Chamaesiphon minutus (strain ATCC 27169 / PCC 6605) TaxID=1173020 RepID=K9UFM6_CHAP6|nr:mechanosensitive ion channel family protein [Chamaesiphon minutus]AFY93453.1 small-conductance mechanosensitive channel [Chamaesiphon minutus PCC 6605]